MNEFRTNIRLVSLNAQGFPDAEGPLSVGDLYLTPSQIHSSEKWDEWIWAGDGPGWQRVGSVEANDDDDERAMRQHRVDRVKQYFKEQELKRLRRNELITSIDRGEHLSREELRELSAMGYAI